MIHEVFTRYYVECENESCEEELEFDIFFSRIEKPENYIKRLGWIQVGYGENDKPPFLSFCPKHSRPINEKGNACES